MVKKNNEKNLKGSASTKQKRKCELSVGTRQKRKPKLDEDESTEPGPPKYVVSSSEV